MKSSLPSLNSLIVLYAFRLLHIGSMVGLGYKIINDYLTNKLSTDHSLFFGLLGVGVMVSGFVNTYLLKPKKMGEARKLWVSWNHVKLLITLILFSPINKMATFLDQNLINLRFYWLLVVLLLSPCARFYRQYWVKSNELNQSWEKIDKKKGQE